MTDLADRILDAALPAIVFDGWTMATLEKAAESIGLTAFDAKRAFPNGAADAVARFSARADEQMLASLTADHDLSKMKIRERIATCVLVRLGQNTPHREAVRRALGFYALPWNALAGLSALYATVDAMWRAAGDTSTDYNFYTKRALLSAVFTSTVRVWLDDTSEDLADTEAFLRRRVENVMEIEKAKAKLRDGFGKLEEWLPPFMKNSGQFQG
ncbi:MAG: COQ9 family protein [Rickettsiales bacterium]